MGDISHLLPSIHPYSGGASGAAHGADFRISDYTQAVIDPAKAMAGTAIDLLAHDAREARQVIGGFRPRSNKDAYLAYLRQLTQVRRWSSPDLERDR